MKISQYAQESILNEICFVIREIREIGEFEFSNFQNFENMQFSDPPHRHPLGPTPAIFLQIPPKSKNIKSQGEWGPSFFW